MSLGSSGKQNCSPSAFRSCVPRPLTFSVMRRPYVLLRKNAPVGWYWVESMSIELDARPVGHDNAVSRRAVMVCRWEALYVQPAETASRYNDGLCGDDVIFSWVSRLYKTAPAVRPFVRKEFDGRENSSTFIFSVLFYASSRKTLIISAPVMSPEECILFREVPPPCLTFILPSGRLSNIIPSSSSQRTMRGASFVMAATKSGWFLKSVLRP